MPQSGPKIITATSSDTIDSIVTQIKVELKGEPKPLIVIFGDFDAATLTPAVQSLCSRAIVPAAVSAGAIIVDNGANSSCSALLGQAARDEDAPPQLIGIATPGSGQSEPNHTVIVQLPAEWSDSSKVLFQIVIELAKDKTGDRPVLAVFFGGDLTEKTALIRCARRGWPVLLIQGSGGVADEILKAMAPGADGNPQAPPADLELREIVETAEIYQFPISGNIDDLSRILLGRIDLRIETLTDAWARYDDLDEAANGKQQIFKKLQLVILVLAVFATLFAILQPGNVMNGEIKSWLAHLSVYQLLRAYKPTIYNVLHVLIVLTPITISVLVSISSRFREGNKWILLRASAEAIKREIFRYRMQAGTYSNEQCVQTSRESKLAAKLKDISSALSQSEVNRTSWHTVVKNQPERITFITPDEYLRVRIDDQINYFVSKTANLYQRLKTMQVWIYVAGGLGTLLAAFKGDVWVALTTAIAAALTTRLETDQVENTLVQYNQALTGLRNITSWWKALTAWEQARPKNIDLLVDQTEKTLEGELAGWVQQMQSALDKQTEKEQQAANKDSGDKGATNN